MFWIIGFFVMWFLAGVMAAAHVNEKRVQPIPRVHSLGLIIIAPFVIAAGVLHGLWRVARCGMDIIRFKLYLRRRRKEQEKEAYNAPDH